MDRGVLLNAVSYSWVCRAGIISKYLQKYDSFPPNESEANQGVYVESRLWINALWRNYMSDSCMVIGMWFWEGVEAYRRCSSIAVEVASNIWGENVGLPSQSCNRVISVWSGPWNSGTVIDRRYRRDWAGRTVCEHVVSIKFKLWGWKARNLFVWL